MYRLRLKEFAKAVLYLLAKVQEPQTESQKAALVTNLNQAFPDAWRDLGNDCYLVATTKPMVSQDISSAAGISSGDAGSYLVTKFDPYYGWASKSIWEWVNTMREFDEHS